MPYPGEELLRREEAEAERYQLLAAQADGLGEQLNEAGDWIRELTGLERVTINQRLAERIAARRESRSPT